MMPANSMMRESHAETLPDTQTLLDGMSGCAYLVAVDGEILATASRNWDRFATMNDAPNLVSRNIIGHNLFDSMSGSEVKEFYSGLHSTLIEETAGSMSFEYRCDAPALERRMLMSVSLINSETSRRAIILYQSQILEERVRVPVPLFGMADYKKHYRDDKLASVCSFCASVAWPIGAAQTDRTWISPEAYYRRGGRSDAVLSHGICPACFESMRTQW